jgi:hypothetical protein
MGLQSKYVRLLGAPTLLIVLAAAIVAGLSLAARREHMEYRPSGPSHSLARDVLGTLPFTPPFGLSRPQAETMARADVHLDGMTVTRAAVRHSRDVIHMSTVPDGYWVWIVELKCRPASNCTTVSNGPKGGLVPVRYGTAEFDYFTGDFVSASISSCYTDPRQHVIDGTKCALP